MCAGQGVRCAGLPPPCFPQAGLLFLRLGQYLGVLVLGNLGNLVLGNLRIVPVMLGRACMQGKVCRAYLCSWLSDWSVVQQAASSTLRAACNGSLGAQYFTVHCRAIARDVVESLPDAPRHNEFACGVCIRRGCHTVRGRRGAPQDGTRKTPAAGAGRPPASRRHRERGAVLWRGTSRS